MNKLEVWLEDSSLVAPPTRVGWVFRDAGRRGTLIRFEYDTAWLDTTGAFAI